MSMLSDAIVFFHKVEVDIVFSNYPIGIFAVEVDQPCFG